MPRENKNTPASGVSEIGGRTENAGAVRKRDPIALPGWQAEGGAPDNGVHFISRKAIRRRNPGQGTARPVGTRRFLDRPRRNDYVALRFPGGALTVTHPLYQSSTTFQVAAGRAVFEAQAPYAEWLGVNRSQVTRAMQGRQRLAATAAERAAALAAIVGSLLTVLDEPAIRGWLFGINAHLGHRRPIDLLHEGAVSEVMMAVEAERSGAFA